MAADQPERRSLIGALIALGLLSLVLGVVGSFYSPEDPHVLGVPIPYGVLIGVLGNLALGFGGARATGSRLAPGVTCAAWVVVALAFSYQRVEGDLVITGNLNAQQAFLYVGFVAGVIPMGLARTGPRQRDGKRHGERDRELDREGDQAEQDRDKTDTSSAPPGPSPTGIARR